MICSNVFKNFTVAGLCRNITCSTRSLKSTLSFQLKSCEAISSRQDMNKYYPFHCVDYQKQTMQHSWSSSKERDSFKNEKWYGVLLRSFITLATFYSSYLLYDNGRKISFVHALEKVNESQSSKKTPRQKYNYVADAVECAAPATVLVEIKSRVSSGNHEVTVSNGTGFIVRDDGLILTNAHVVRNEKTLLIKLSDGRSFHGVVQALDPTSDLATIKIPGKNLPCLKLGNSDDLRAGELVIAVGNPLQLSNTVTAGVVSTTHRQGAEFGIKNADMQYIQTDAIINFGNSGGPLVNLDGEAIGINTLKIAEGISFAIPSNYAKNFLEKAAELEKRGKTIFQRPYIGVTMVTLGEPLLSNLRLRTTLNLEGISHGVLIQAVTLDAPAHISGIMPLDIITHINNKPIMSSQDVYKCVAENQTLNVRVVRDGRQLKFTVHVHNAQ